MITVEDFFIAYLAAVVLIPFILLAVLLKNVNKTIVHSRKSKQIFIMMFCSFLFGITAFAFILHYKNHTWPHWISQSTAESFGTAFLISSYFYVLYEFYNRLSSGELYIYDAVFAHSLLDEGIVVYPKAYFDNPSAESKLNPEKLSDFYATNCHDNQTVCITTLWGPLFFEKKIDQTLIDKVKSCNWKCSIFFHFPILNVEDPYENHLHPKNIILEQFNRREKIRQLMDNGIQVFFFTEPFRYHINMLGDTAYISFALYNSKPEKTHFAPLLKISAVNKQESFYKELVSEVSYLFKGLTAKQRYTFEGDEIVKIYEKAENWNDGIIKDLQEYFSSHHDNGKDEYCRL